MKKKFITKKIINLLFNVYNKDTLYDLEKYLTILKSNKYNVYLLGYDKELSEKNADEFNYTTEVEELSKKYGCEFEYITIEDIYKVKAIILESIGKYLLNLGS